MAGVYEIIDFVLIIDQLNITKSLGEFPEEFPSVEWGNYLANLGIFPRQISEEIHRGISSRKTRNR